MANSKITSAPKRAAAKEEKKETVMPTEEVVQVEKKKFSATELVPCLSITPGEMFYEGEKTKTLYTWANAEDIIGIEYQDLAYAARSKNQMMYKPRYIVQDQDFLNEFPQLEAVYNGLYSVADLEDILKLPPTQMERAIIALPEGAKDALQTLVATKIDNGTLDSVKRIQKLDEIFDTKMLMRLFQE